MAVHIHFLATEPGVFAGDCQRGVISILGNRRDPPLHMGQTVEAREER